MAEPMKIRAQMMGDVVDIKVLMLHIMETGLRKDAKTGKVIPAHFIQSVSAEVNDKTVIEAQWGVAVSKNPFLGFKIKGAKPGDKVVINAIDNKGEKSRGETTIV